MFKQEMADRICEQLAQGNTSLRKICSQEGYPAVSTFLLWCSENKELAEHYARARDVGNNVEFEGIVELADEQPPIDDKGKVDPAWVTWQKNRIDARKWTLSKKDPKRYGDKVETTLQGPDGGAVQIQTITRKIVDPAKK